MQQQQYRVPHPPSGERYPRQHRHGRTQCLHRTGPETGPGGGRSAARAAAHPELRPHRHAGQSGGGFVFQRAARTAARNRARIQRLQCRRIRASAPETRHDRADRSILEPAEPRARPAPLAGGPRSRDSDRRERRRTQRSRQAETDAARPARNHNPAHQRQRVHNGGNAEPDRGHAEGVVRHPEQLGIEQAGTEGTFLRHFLQADRCESESGSARAGKPVRGRRSGRLLRPRQTARGRNSGPCGANPERRKSRCDQGEDGRNPPDLRLRGAAEILHSGRQAPAGLPSRRAAAALHDAVPNRTGSGRLPVRRAARLHAAELHLKQPAGAPPLGHLRQSSGARGGGGPEGEAAFSAGLGAAGIRQPHKAPAPEGPAGRPAPAIRRSGRHGHEHRQAHHTRIRFGGGAPPG